ncbi:hypothetical protein Sste5344_003717 [Sporothrix stenoceras]
MANLAVMGDAIFKVAQGSYVSEEVASDPDYVLASRGDIPAGSSIWRGMGRKRYKGQQCFNTQTDGEAGAVVRYGALALIPLALGADPSFDDTDAESYVSLILNGLSMVLRLK